jgi:hypothetical protein
MKAVYLNDEGKSYEEAKTYFLEADAWALHNCQSYVGFNSQDVSDFSMYHDLVAQFTFLDEQDVVLFTLKFK